MIEMATGADIERELRSVAKGISEPTRFTLFGGCCLSVRGIKAATKDTDVVVEGPHIQTLLADLEKVGYKPWEEPWSIVFDGYVIVEKLNGVRIDLFPPDRIFDSPGFTPTMRTRAEPWFTAGNLEVHLADLTTVFLFKAITGRWRHEPDRDISDLRRVLTRGSVDWAVLETEWRRFANKTPAVIDKAREAVALLREYGLAVPWQP